MMSTDFDKKNTKIIHNVVATAKHRGTYLQFHIQPSILKSSLYMATDISASAIAVSFNICSIISLVHPYGLVQPKGSVSSLNGTSSEMLYTVADELKMNFLTPFSFIAYRREAVG